MTLRKSEAMSMARVHDESSRKDGPVRILIVEASGPCRLKIATGDNAEDCLDRVEVIEGTEAELRQHASDSWDLMITHVHEPPIDDTSVLMSSFAVELPGDVSRPQTEQT